MARVPAILVTHADLGAALRRAAEKVYGPADDLLLLSNEGHSREGLERAIDEAIGHWERGGLVLTDFWGGSCTLCGLAAARRRGEVVVVSGLNLPILLDYLHNRDQVGVFELAERLRVKGQESIRVQRGQPA